MTSEPFEQPHDVSAHQGFAPCHPQFPDAAGDEHGAKAVQLFQGQEVSFWQKSHVLRHAIHAAEVATVCD